MTYNDAFLAAGYKSNKKAAAHSALLQRPLIRAALYQKTKEAEREGSISAGQWLREISHLAFMPASMLNGPPGWDHKLKALEMMGRYQKWLTENVNIRAQIGVSHLFGAATQAVMAEAIRTNIAIEAALEDKSKDKNPIDALSEAVLEYAPASSNDGT